jgi:guanylate kinase
VSVPLDDAARARGRDRALQARRRRAEVKADLAAGRTDLASVLAARRDPVIARLRVQDVLRSLPGIGAARAGVILDDCRIDPKRRLGQLGDQQVAHLARVLSDRGSGYATPRAAPPARLLVLSGPSGVGKSSVVAYLREHFPRLWFSVSVTTRTPRPGEVDGVDYHFVSDAEFTRLRDSGLLLEWAQFAGNSYGTPSEPVLARLEEGQPVICEIDLQGARQVRARDPHALLVFLSPPSWQVLVERLTGRGTEEPHVIAQRLQVARRELAAEAEFDVVVVNDSIARAAEEIMALAEG